MSLPARALLILTIIIAPFSLGWIPVPRIFPDEVMHVVVFAVIAFFLRAIMSTGKVFVFAAALMMFDELCQINAPGRAFQWEDLLCDLAGTCLGVCVYHLIKIRRSSVLTFS